MNTFWVNELSSFPNSGLVTAQNFLETSRRGRMVLFALPPNSLGASASASSEEDVIDVNVDTSAVGTAEESFFMGLGDLPGGEFSSEAWGISADGSAVVGRSSSANSPGLLLGEAFRWTEEGGMVGLGDLPGKTFFSTAFGTNADGSVVAGGSTSAKNKSGFPETESFRWTEESGMVGLGDLPKGSFNSSAYAVSADGSVIVGIGDSAKGQKAFRWTEESGMVGLGFIAGGDFSLALDVSADGSVIVGWSTITNGNQAFRWTEESGMVGLGFLPGGSSDSQAYGISSDGSVVVGASNSANTPPIGTYFEAFRWTEESGMVGIGDLPGGDFNGRAEDVSADGSVVVGFSNSANGNEAFLWDSTNGMRSLEEVLINEYGLDLSGWTLEEATDISDDGKTIVGYGINPDGNKEAWIARLGEIPSEGTTTRVSVSSKGTQGNSFSFTPSISGDGRYVAFGSFASNLVGKDTNDSQDIFLRDRATGQTSRVSVSANGQQGNASSRNPSLSGDGRYVAFSSEASNLVFGDTNGYEDIFVRDRTTGETSRINIAFNGLQSNDESTMPAISADGRYVAFASLASNLVPGDSNGTWDVFVHDRVTGQISSVSVTPYGTQGNSESLHPSISSDGRYVAFASAASDLVFGDTNDQQDCFVHDRLTGETTRVSVASNGTEGNIGSYSPAISADGRYVAFESNAFNLVPQDTNFTSDIFVRDRVKGRTSRVSITADGSEGNNGSFSAAISPDGRYVAFDSYASNLVPGDTNDVGDCFVHDRLAGETIRVSVASNGIEGNNGSYSSAISADGSKLYVAFTSDAANLVPGDTNFVSDIFVHEREETEPPPPSISISNAKAVEGKNLSFKVTLSRPSEGDIKVTYITKDGSGDNGAVAGEDYVFKQGTLTIPAGQEKAVIRVQTILDGQAEGNEKMFLQLKRVVEGEATIADGKGAGTIEDYVPIPVLGPKDFNANLNQDTIRQKARFTDPDDGFNNNIGQTAYFDASIPSEGLLQNVGATLAGDRPLLDIAASGDFYLDLLPGADVLYHNFSDGPAIGPGGIKFTAHFNTIGNPATNTWWLIPATPAISGQDPLLPKAATDINGNGTFDVVFSERGGGKHFYFDPINGTDGSQFQLIGILDGWEIGAAGEFDGLVTNPDGSRDVDYIMKQVGGSELRLFDPEDGLASIPLANIPLGALPRGQADIKGISLGREEIFLFNPNSGQAWFYDLDSATAFAFGTPTPGWEQFA